MDFLKINRAAWDQRSRIHMASEFYDVEGFLAGRSSLMDIEAQALGDVAGQRLLHLQCHFGLDTLSWARAGARVTGVDLSPVAIDYARTLASRSGLEAAFICKDVYAFAEQGRADYDIVFTSYGAICWLPDLDAWADTIRRHLRDGGVFYMVEFHPAIDFHLGDAYFHQAEPYVDDSGTYTENAGDAKAKMVTWAHSLADVVTALLKAGIRIDDFREFPFSPYNCFPDLREEEPGRFFYRQGKHHVPMLFSIKGTKSPSAPKARVSR